MTNDELILQKVRSFYNKRDNMGKIIGEKIPYTTLCENHLTVIHFLNDFWQDIILTQPREQEKVIVIQDLTAIGRGKFIDNFFYENNYFIDALGDDDPHGYITHWVSVDFLNQLPDMQEALAKLQFI